jgi:hypothetical protein
VIHIPTASFQVSSFGLKLQDEVGQFKKDPKDVKYHTALGPVRNMSDGDMSVFKSSMFLGPGYMAMQSRSHGRSKGTF